MAHEHAGHSRPRRPDLPLEVRSPLGATFPSSKLAVVTVIYRSNLQILGGFYTPLSQATARVFSPPPISNTFAAGFAAGSIQSVFAAPLVVLQNRFKTSNMLEGHYKNMSQYSASRLRELGLRSMFVGSSLILIMGSLGLGAFFATFEDVKAQCFCAFVTRYYGRIDIASDDDCIGRLFGHISR